MIIRTIKQLHWHAQLRTSIAALIALSILFSMGQWQLKRAKYKEKLYTTFYNNHQRTLQPETILTQKPLQQNHYQRVELQGYFDNKNTFLQDNQIYHGNIGYYLFTPFYAKKIKRWLLINRGFLPRILKKKRLEAYVVPKLNSPKTIYVIINSYPKTTILLGENIETMTDGKYLIQDLRFPALNNILKLPLIPATGLLLSPKESFTISWKPNITVSATRHRAYAFQWFSMAAILVIIYLALNCSIRKLK